MVSQATEYQLLGIVLNGDANEMKIDLSEPRKIRIVGVHEKSMGPPKEYFLKVTERGGLVLI